MNFKHEMRKTMEYLRYCALHCVCASVSVNNITLRLRKMIMSKSARYLCAHISTGIFVLSLCSPFASVGMRRFTFTQTQRLALVRCETFGSTFDKFLLRVHCVIIIVSNVVHSLATHDSSCARQLLYDSIAFIIIILESYVCFPCSMLIVSNQEEFVVVSLKLLHFIILNASNSIINAILNETSISISISVYLSIVPHTYVLLFLFSLTHSLNSQLKWFVESQMSLVLFLLFLFLFFSVAICVLYFLFAFRNKWIDTNAIEQQQQPPQSDSLTNDVECILLQYLLNTSRHSAFHFILCTMCSKYWSKLRIQFILSHFSFFPPHNFP